MNGQGGQILSIGQHKKADRKTRKQLEAEIEQLKGGMNGLATALQMLQVTQSLMLEKDRYQVIVKTGTIQNQAGQAQAQVILTPIPLKRPPCAGWSHA